MNTHYKEYELVLNDDGDVIAVVLDGEELENGTPDTPSTLEEAIEWIEEDIKCRDSEAEEERRVFLKEGDILHADMAKAVIGKNDVICFDGWHDDVMYYCDGHIVEFDDDGKPYIAFFN